MTTTETGWCYASEWSDLRSFHKLRWSCGRYHRRDRTKCEWKVAICDCQDRIKRAEPSCSVDLDSCQCPKQVTPLTSLWHVNGGKAKRTCQADFMRQKTVNSSWCPQDWQLGQLSRRQGGKIGTILTSSGTSWNISQDSKLLTVLSNLADRNS